MIRFGRCDDDERGGFSSDRTRMGRGWFLGFGNYEKGYRVINFRVFEVEIWALVFLRRRGYLIISGFEGDE